MFTCTHTYFSLKYGTISPRELIEEAEKNGVKNFALTDINNTSAIFDMLRQLKNTEIKVAAGIDFRNGAQQKFVGIAKNNTGFYELNAFLSFHAHEEKEIPDTAPAFDNAWVIYPYGTKQPKDLRDNEFVGLRISQVNKLLFSKWKKNTKTNWW